MRSLVSSDSSALRSLELFLSEEMRDRLRAHEHRDVVLGGVVHGVHAGVDGGVAHVDRDVVEEGVHHFVCYAVDEGLVYGVPDGVDEGVGCS